MIDESRPLFTRRQFIHCGVALASTVATVPIFLQHSAAALAAPMDGSAVKNRPGVPDDRVLVVIQLSGGNDGLNTVIPFGQDEYYRARPRLAIAKKDVLVVDAKQGLGLHPQMSGLKQLFEEGAASIIQGVGYPNPNRSHFESMDIWHTADATGTGGRGTGWLGRALDEKTPGADHPDALTCVCFGQKTELATKGLRTSPLTFDRPEQLQWSGAQLHGALSAQYDQISRAGVIEPVKASDRGSQAAFVMRAALDAQVAPQRVKAAIAKGTATKFPGGRLANQLRMVAAMIRAGLPTRVYYVSIGGFDTHANQPGQQSRLLEEFARGVQAFHAEVKAQGAGPRVLTLAFSEFGRRVEQNASNGTDHGTAAPLFMFGDAVRPGILGDHPSLTKLDQGDLIYTVDFRNIYAAVLDQWLRTDAAAVLGKPFQPAQILNPAKV